MDVYKIRVVSFIEYRSAAIYHASDTVLHAIDGVQARFLRDMGVTAIKALLDFNLAPLGSRRDIAMLGLIQRTV